MLRLLAFHRQLESTQVGTSETAPRIDHVHGGDPHQGSEEGRGLRKHDVGE